VDEEWHGLLDELEPILSKTVDSAAAHTTPSSWTGTALKAIGGTFLKYMGVGMTTSFLYQIEPSTLINSLTKGLRNGFFSHQTQ
jgi:threonine/homoserine/homoserine lactone efflux protein